MRATTAWPFAGLALLLALGLSVGLKGNAPFGRLALALGLNGPAAELLEDPLWRGIALYRAGRFEPAAEAFRQAGPRASYNRGNALARAGRYEEAVAAYDAVLYRTPQDEAARINRALVATLATAILGEVRAGGRVAAEGTTSGPAGAERTETSTVTGVKVHDVRRPFDGHSIAASRQWLATLADDPGRYLKLRIAAEHRQRVDAGLAPPPAESPW